MTKGSPKKVLPQLRSDAEPTESLSQLVFDRLRQEIVNGDFAPGQRLVVRDLAKQMNTSVMPIRDAVNRLVAEGLAEHEPYKGARVRAFDTDNLVQMYDARSFIEGEAARRGAISANAKTIEEMETHWFLLERAAQRGDVSAALRQDELLLGALYTAANNDVFVEIIRDLWDRCRPYRNIWASGSDDVFIWRNKPSLIEAAQKNDGEAAQQIIARSYLEAQNAIRESIERKSVTSEN